ncbi:MAG: hypothetical protein COU47_02645 [Candidatus Niyogibacteria bacterium CG10_big_fil_rev_8_21_14_0_10_46_36]|uniref:Uncharacterized protein n=1 Tax=Candidatus Niyogibacteria bacterium CG10_big_fil_rev_8_21_14_0_10_46_36 TaxID=1974726 RepID=A0A2H0TD33_9BACT|nr:MAG: hypothetical protein COU47_02645 [Candidatus Niyogibacteria bacterium CG10_big_fil_rev_8_21_14_0_10_46_36]
MAILFALFSFYPAHAGKNKEPEACGPNNTQQSLVRNGTFLFSDRDKNAVSSGVVYQIIPLQPDGFETIVVHSHPSNSKDPRTNVAFAIFEWSCDKQGVRLEDIEQCGRFWQYYAGMDEDFREAYVYEVKSHEVVPDLRRGKVWAIDARVVTRWVREGPQENIYANKAFLRNQITGEFDLIHERRFFNRNHCPQGQDDPREGAHERIEFFTDTFPRFYAVGFANMFTVKINGNRERILFYSYNDGLYNFANFWDYPYAIRGTPADFLMFYDKKEKTSNDAQPGGGSWVGLNRDRIVSMQNPPSAQDPIIDNPFSTLYSEEMPEAAEASSDALPSVYRWVEERERLGVTELPEDIQDSLNY